MAASALWEAGGGEPPLKFSGNGKFPLNGIAAVFFDRRSFKPSWGYCTEN